MANLVVKDGAAASKYVKTSGAGTDPDPHIPEHLESNSAAIKTAVETIGNAIAGSEMQVDVVTSALPTGAATAANQSTANTSLSSLEAKIGEVQASPTSNTVLDRLKQIYTAITGTLTVATHAVTQSGTWIVGLSLPTTAQTSHAAINISSSGDNTVIAGTGGQTIRVYKLFLVASAAVSLKYKDGAGADLTPALSMAANGGMVLDFDSEPWFVTSPGNDFIANLSAAVQVSGRIYYSKS